MSQKPVWGQSHHSRQTVKVKSDYSTLGRHTQSIPSRPKTERCPESRGSPVFAHICDYEEANMAMSRDTAVFQGALFRICMST